MQLYILSTYYQFQLPNSKGVLLYTVWCSALSAALGSPFGRAKAACNRIYGHKKRSVSALIRSINCFTNPARKPWALFSLSKKYNSALHKSLPCVKGKRSAGGGLAAAKAGREQRLGGIVRRNVTNLLWFSAKTKHCTVTIPQSCCSHDWLPCAKGAGSPSGKTEGLFCSIRIHPIAIQHIGIRLATTCKSFLTLK